VIPLARAWFPRGFLACEHYCHAIEVCDDAAIDRLVDREQPCLVCQELAHRSGVIGAAGVPGKLNLGLMLIPPNANHHPARPRLRCPQAGVAWV